MPMCEIGFGIDGGGTRSRLCLFSLEDGRELGRFAGGSTNMYSVGRDAAMQNIVSLLRSSGVSLERLKAGCLGSAGLSRPAEKEVFSDFFRRLLPQCRIYLCNDGETLLVGALKSTEGYCLIAGTGSLALARDHEGRTARAGGLGYMLGDEGSALWIAWQAIGRAMRSREGRDLETTLLADLVKHFSLSCPEDFVEMLHHRFEKAVVATAAGLVLDRVEDDPLAVFHAGRGGLAEQDVAGLVHLVFDAVLPGECHDVVTDTLLVMRRVGNGAYLLEMLPDLPGL